MTAPERLLGARVTIELRLDGRDRSCLVTSTELLELLLEYKLAAKAQAIHVAPELTSWDHDQALRVAANLPRHCVPSST